jgi:hypothetical protein
MRRLVIFVGLVAAAVSVPAAVGANDVLDISPKQVKFGKHPFGSLLRETITLTNAGTSSVLVDVETQEMPDDFSPGQPESTCTLPEDKLLGAGESCTHVVVWQSESGVFAGHRSATLAVIVKDPTDSSVLETHTVRLSALAVP